MNPYQEVMHMGRRIVISDFSNTTPEEQMAGMPVAQKGISSNPSNSVLLLTDVTGLRFNAASVSALKEWAKQNTPYVKASAVVGATVFFSAVLGTIRLMTGRDIRTFRNRGEAMDWLVESGRQ